MYAYRSLKLREEMGDKDGIQSIRILLGIIYSEIGDYDTALSFHHSTLALLRATNSRWGMATSLNNIAQIYLKQGRLDTALSTAQACYSIAQGFNSKEKLMDISRTLGDIYAAKGDFANAYTYLKRAEILKDSVLNEQNVRAIANMQALYDAQRRQTQIELLKKENENQTLVRNLLIGIVLLLSVIAILAGSSYRQKKRAAAQYKAQNDSLIKLNALLAEERQRAELERQRAEEASMFKTELLSIAAHDLKNPLQSILGFSMLILEEITEQSPIADKIKAIQRAAERMLALIKDFLETAAIDSQQIQLKKQKVYIVDLLYRVLDANRLQAEMKLQQLGFEVLSPNAVVEIDIKWMREVFENLVSNAIKFTPFGKHISVVLSESEDSVRVEVRDEGQGLTAEDMSKLFGKFQRLSARPTGNETSTGLGLSIAKQIIELHGGKIWAESEGQGKGATFIVELPKVPTDEPHATKLTVRA
ncbi:MAG: ATP-binding protein [Candidatus Thermochlorobacter sp.]